MRRLILLAMLCSMLTAQAASAATIQVLVPNGGERWMEGSSYRVRWKSTDVQKVNISFAVGGKDLGAVGPIAAKNGLYQWSIPRGFVTNFGANAGVNQMTVLIEDADPAMSDISDKNDRPFSVVRASAPPPAPPSSQEPTTSTNTGLPQSGQATTMAVLIAVLGALITLMVATKRQRAL